MKIVLFKLGCFRGYFKLSFDYYSDIFTIYTTRNNKGAPGIDKFVVLSPYTVRNYLYKLKNKGECMHNSTKSHT